MSVAGQIESRILLRGGPAPQFEVEDIEGRLFYRDSPRSIVCFVM